MHVVTAAADAPARPPIVSKAAFSRLASVTRGAISIALAAGRIRATADGRMDPADSLNAAWLANPRRQRRQAQRQAQRTTGASAAAPPVDLPPTATPGPLVVHLPTPTNGNGRTSGNDTSQRNTQGLLEIDGETFGMADLRDKIAAADLKEQKLARDRGELVDTAGVRAVFAAIYTVHTGQLRALAQKLGPEVVVALGLQDAETMRVQELMDLEVRRSLAQIKRAIDDYLAAVGAEPVQEAPRAL